MSPFILLLFVHKTFWQFPNQFSGNQNFVPKTKPSPKRWSRKQCSSEFCSTERRTHRNGRINLGLYSLFIVQKPRKMSRDNLSNIVGFRHSRTRNGNGIDPCGTFEQIMFSGTIFANHSNPVHTLKAYPSLKTDKKITNFGQPSSAATTTINLVPIWLTYSRASWLHWPVSKSGRPGQNNGNWNTSRSRHNTPPLERL